MHPQKNHTTALPIERTEVILPGVVEPAGLVVQTSALAPLAHGRVLLRMEATGISFAEQQMRLGRYYDQPAFPFVPGYDVVGTAIGAGPGVRADVIGRRFAAVTKTGAWAEYVDVDARALMDVPASADPADIETVIVNGITAWRMLHDVARTHAGGTVVVMGANGGVGSTLVQMAKASGMRVIGTASARHHGFVRTMGAEVVDYTNPDFYDHIRELAPEGVDAVFDHVGGAGLVRSWSLVRRGGALVSYGTAAAKNGRGNLRLSFLALFARLALWNALPNGRRASFYNFWDGITRPDHFFDRQREAFAHVVELVASGALVPQIAARVPLADVVRALQLAESRTVAGKVVIVPA